MSMIIRKAVRKNAKLRIGISALAGAGKTMSSLLVAKGLAGPNGKIGVIDTERGSASLYADKVDFDVIELNKPFTVKKYLEAIEAFENAGYDVIVIDSLSHAWTGQGGLLEKQQQMSSGLEGDKTNAWREITPEHNKLVDAMLESSCDIIATTRAKAEYVVGTDSQGNATMNKIGTKPVQREGMEYEFTVFLDIDLKTHKATASKDRTEIFSTFNDVLDERLGKKLADWRNKGEQVGAVKQENINQSILGELSDIEKEFLFDATQRLNDSKSKEEMVQIYKEVYSKAKLLDSELLIRRLEQSKNDLKDKLGYN